MNLTVTQLLECPVLIFPHRTENYHYNPNKTTNNIYNNNNNNNRNYNFPKRNSKMHQKYTYSYTHFNIKSTLIFQTLQTL